MSRLPLFRQEAFEHHRATWLGEILLARPASFAALTLLFLGLAVAVVAYLVWGEYTRKARVTGYLVPDQGVVKVFSQQVGTVTGIRIKEGQVVRRGDILLSVSAERTSSHGGTQAGIAAHLLTRRLSLQEEMTKVRQLYSQRNESGQQRLRHLQEEHAEVERAIDAQRQRVQLSETVVERHVRLHEDKFISELGLQDKRADLLDQQNRLRELLRARSVSGRDILVLQSDLLGYPIKAQSEIDALERSISELSGNSIENEARREEYVLAAQDGMVTAIQTNVGKQVTPNHPLMSLIPTGTRLQVELYVPSRAVGFVRVGNETRIQYQAFPYQKFGSHSGRVIRVARTAVPSNELPFPAPSADVFYVVTVEPASGQVLAYGRAEPLQSGMQVNADIWLDRRSLIEWIAEPLFSVSGRL